MKLRNLLFATLSTGIFLSACQENLAPVDVASPEAQALTIGCMPQGGYIYPSTLLCPSTIPDDIQIDPSCTCEPEIGFGLVSSSGSIYIDNCIGGCTGQTPWGEGYLNYGLDGLPQSYILRFSLAPGLYASRVDWTNAPTGTQPFNNNNFPTLLPTWNSKVFPVPVSCFSTDLTQLGTGCEQIAAIVTVSRRSFFGSPIAGTTRQLHLLFSTYTQDDNVVEVCHNGCPPVITNLTGGTCAGCDSENNITFYDSDSVDVSSCQNIAKIRVVYDDCSDVLLVNNGTARSHHAPAGREISHIFVKSGCNGPGDGRRFDAPAVNPACN